MTIYDMGRWGGGVKGLVAGVCNIENQPINRMKRHVRGSVSDEFSVRNTLCCTAGVGGVHSGMPSFFSKESTKRHASAK